MKIIVILACLAINLSLFAQKDSTELAKQEKREIDYRARMDARKKSKEQNKLVDETTDKISKNISFIVGPGASIITGKVYDDPSVNATNNFVSIEDGPKTKSNVAIGIAYTPRVRRYAKNPKIIYDKAGNEAEVSEITERTSGITIAAFINPISLKSQTASQSFLNMVDFGIGLGHKFEGGLLLMGTFEFFSVRQPRKWFIDQFKGTNTAYIIDSAPQKSIDLKDNNIFTNKGVATLGFKICYSFDIIKSYVTGTNLESIKAK